MLYYKEDVWDFLEEFAREANQPHQVMNIVHARMRERLYKQQEREQLKKEITEDVLSRISIMFETGEAIKQINSLNKAIEQLGK